jgi:hypothetical protein
MSDINYLAAYIEDGSWVYEICFVEGNTDGDVLPGNYATAGDALLAAADKINLQVVEEDVSEEFGHEAAVYYF